MLDLLKLSTKNKKDSQTQFTKIPSNSSLIWSHNQVLRPENSKEDTCGGPRLVRDQLEG